jgi:glycosyltransferase involved in cell wall biosynthesis
MSRIRVLRVITRLNVGGPSIQAVLLAQRLDPERFETLLVAGQEGATEGNLLRLRSLDSVRSLTVPELGRRIAPLDDLRALAKVTAIARRYRPHIVHTHLAKAGFIGRIAGRLSGAPVIIHTYHGSVFRGYFGRHQSALYMGIERSLGRLTTRIVAITPRQRAELIQLRIAPSAKTVEIPLGFDLSSFRDAMDRDTARARLHLAGSAPVVGLVARLVPIKDVPTFLRALSILSESLPTVQALIVGDGDDRSALEKLSGDLGLRGRCRFLGWRADMSEIYAAVDVVALSSLNEGAPVTAIEAMAAGRPVVATAVGGVPDVVLHERTGLLTPPRAPQALAAALRTLLTDEPLRDAYGRAGQEYALRCFGASRLVADIERLYLEQLAAHCSVGGWRWGRHDRFD